MITVQVLENAIQVKGHADFAERGKDIVCAAVSALFQTFLLTMDKIKAETKDKYIYDIKAGESVIMFHERKSQEAQLLILSFRTGIEAIAESYPDNVRII